MLKMAPHKKTESSNNSEVNLNQGVTTSTDAPEIIPSIDPEKEQLKSEIEQLKEMMSQLIAQQNQVKTETIESQPIKKSLFDSTEQRYDIDPKTYVSIVSLVNGGLHLKGLHTIYSIPEFGKSISVSFEDLRSITNNHPLPTREGMYLIKSEKAVKALSLEQYYEKFINEDSIQKFMLLNNNEIKEIFDTTTDSIKQTIVEKIVNGVADGDPLYQDRNKVKYIGDLVGKNLNEYVREIEDTQ